MFSLLKPEIEWGKLNTNTYTIILYMIVGDYMYVCKCKLENIILTAYLK